MDTGTIDVLGYFVDYCDKVFIRFPSFYGLKFLCFVVDYWHKAFRFPSYFLVEGL